MPPVQLDKRAFWGDPYEDGDNGWYDYGRWILLAVIIFVCIVSFLFVQGLSCRRARHGQHPIAGTSWMVPPSYYQSQQQQNQEDAVPMYKQEAGQGDAGHYDSHGNFVPYTGPQYGYGGQGSYTNTYAPDYTNYAPPPGPPPPSDDPPAASSSSPDNYAPPAVPPPSHAGRPHYDDIGPPDGPPPAARDYYRPSKDPADPVAPQPAHKAP